MAENSSQLASLWLEIKDTVKLNIDYAKLTTAEKSSILLSTVAFALMAFVALSAVIFFISMGLTMLLSEATGIFGACMIMAGIYVIAIIIIYLCRKQLIVNPVARFVSHLILHND